MLSVRSCAALVFVLVAASLSHAAIISGPYSGWQGTQLQDPLGQSFRANTTAVSQIGFLFANWTATPQTIDLSLYEGVDFGGIWQATRTLTLPSGFQGWQGAWFSGTQLRSGRDYAVKIHVPSGENIDVNWQPVGSGYADGTTILKGAPDNSTDLAFFVNDPVLANGYFSTGNTSGWSGQFEGGAGLITTRWTGSGYVAELTAGSAVSLQQSFDLPSDPFGVHVDYMFLEPGTLEIYLGDQLLRTIGADAPTGWTSEVVGVLSPGLLGSNQSLKLRFDGTTGSRLQVDNIYLTDVPEPFTFPLLVVGSLVLRRRHGSIGR